MLRAVCLVLITLVALPASAATTFDHFETGFELDGAHRNVECSQCHLRGIFRGTPTRCESCHDGSGFNAQTSKPPTHVMTTEVCEACHVTADWSAVPFVDHSQVQGTCAACHDGLTATGKPPNHPQSSDDCETCHTTFSWSGALFDHAGITTGCFTCHDGVQATGKHPGHIPSNDICEDCHNTQSWTPALFDHAGVMPGTCVTCHDGITATGKGPGHIASGDVCDDCHTTQAWTPAVFDHAGVMPGTCATCHDGVTATGKDAQHIQTMSSCDVCHSTIAWIPATFDHQGVTGSCSSCHDGVQATGTPAGHFTTTQECDACHTTSFWTPSTFVHSSASYPGDHAVSLGCTDCHGSNSEIVTWSSPALQPDCAGCHANDFRSGSHKKTETPTTIFYTVDELRDCTGACHMYTDDTFTTIKEFRPGPEHSVGRRDW